VGQPDDLRSLSPLRWSRREKLCALCGCVAGLGLQGILTDLSVPWLGVGVAATLAAGIMWLAFDPASPAEHDRRGDGGTA